MAGIRWTGLEHGAIWRVKQYRLWVTGCKIPVIDKKKTWPLKDACAFHGDYNDFDHDPTYSF